LTNITIASFDLIHHGVSLRRQIIEVQMKRGKIISLNGLTRSHGDQIDQMLKGIRGSATLWTAEMRAATRGGKCLVGISNEKSNSTLTNR